MLQTVSSEAKPDHAPVFDRLVEAAEEVLVLPHETANRQAYEAANAVLIERADQLVAVWNGAPVDVVWPDGAARRS